MRRRKYKVGAVVTCTRYCLECPRSPVFFFFNKVVAACRGGLLSSAVGRVSRTASVGQMCGEFMALGILS
eukprot:COSAG01_NODE_65_length_29252_cov_173.296995_28_plen_70_part_00